MKANRYPGTCSECFGPVAARAGVLGRKVGGRYTVRHLACADAGESAVSVLETSSGTYIQNRRGRCEDAPCCGCCTY
jgi:hypothetical protein